MYQERGRGRGEREREGGMAVKHCLYTKFKSSMKVLNVVKIKVHILFLHDSHGHRINAIIVIRYSIDVAKKDVGIWHNWPRVFIINQ